MTPQEYEHVVVPFDHQKQHFEQHCETKVWGLLWEMGTAKTKPIIDTAAYLYLRNKIDGMLVVAPAGVERNWNTDEIPAHLPLMDTMVAVFLTSKKNTKTHKAQLEALIKHEALSILLISYNAFITKEGKDIVRKFLQRRRTLYVLDESHNIKTPKAKRTKSIVMSSKYADYRRILTGTPISASPFDLYSQIRFLDNDFWKRRGIQGAVEFRQYFGEWFTRGQCQELHGYDPGYDKLIRYKNLDQLEKWISEISDRVLKEDVLDLPPKLYSKRYVAMTKEQKAIYEELRDEYIYQFDNGDVVDGELPIVRLLRLQQVLCNYVPTEEEPVRLLSSKNPRLEAMEQIRDETHSPAIVWARFRQDINQLMDLFGSQAVRYDGQVDEDTAERNRLAFQKGDAKWFVGTAQKGGPGITLHNAKTVVYYSNSFRLVDRLQSEDRAHRAGMDDNAVNYIDIVCPDSVDEKIVSNLRNKRDIASSLLGDELREWI